jgi:hypothetical protein
MTDTSASWDPHETVRLVHEMHGHEQSRLAEAVMHAVRRKIGFACFHTGEVLRHFNTADASVLRGKGLPEVLFDPERMHRHHDMQYAMAAHTSAAVENLHATADLLARSVQCAFNLQVNGALSAPTEFSQLLAQLRQRHDYAVVAAQMNSLRSASSFEYLEAIVEEGREGRIVSASIVFDNTGRDSEVYRLRFPAFVHRGKQMPARDVGPFLLTEGLRVQKAVQLPWLL